MKIGRYRNHEVAFAILRLTLGINILLHGLTRIFGPGAEVFATVTKKQFENTFKELSENWRHLNSKAQGNIAISGILLAAGIAFLGRGQTLPSIADRVLIVLAVVNLVR
jgi:uncharacterized membrane protein YphA (DoxX/SURF4 family)